MWFLKQEFDREDEEAGNSVPSRVPMVAGHNYTIGRKDAKLLLQGDQSISRLHAAVDVVAQTPDKPSHLLLVDHSKFGTFVDDGRIPEKTPTEVADGALIRFGMLKNRYRVQQFLVVTTSNMAGEDKSATSQMISKLGGRILPRWSENCEFLVMKRVTVTIKVVEALAACRPIVVPDYFKLLHSCAVNGQRCPDPVGYIPALSDDSLQGLDKTVLAVNYSRRALFAGKTFYFLTERLHAELKQVVFLAGGKACLMASEPADGNIDAVIADGTCVVLPKVKTPWGATVSAHLDQNGLRGIEHSELGFALVYNNAQSYTNPTGPPTVHSQYSQSHRMSSSQARRQPGSRVTSSQSLATSSQSTAAPRPAATATAQPSASRPQPSSQHPAAATAVTSSSRTKASTPAAGASVAVNVKPKTVAAGLVRPAAPAADTVGSVTRATDQALPRDVRPLDGAATAKPRSSEELAEQKTRSASEGLASRAITPTKANTAARSHVPIKPEPVTPVPFQHGKRSHGESVSNSPEDEPLTKRARAVSPVRAVRSRRTRVASPEPSLAADDDVKPELENSTVGDGERSRGLSQSQASYIGDADTKYSAHMEVYDDIPKNLMLVRMVSLVSSSTADRNMDNEQAAADGVNFKKFQKVWPLAGTLPAKHAKMPRIIGGDALVVHTSASRELDQFLMQEQEANAEMRRQDEFAADLFRSDSMKGKQQRRARR